MTDHAPQTPAPVRPRLLSRREASGYLLEAHGLTCAAATLAKYASTGGGPVYRRFGHQVVYAPADLDAWASTRVSGPVATASELRR
jgi:hypothetical protein